MQQPLYKIILTDIINPISDIKANLIRRGAIALKRTRSADNNITYKIEKIGKETEVLKHYHSRTSIEVLELPNLIAMPAFFDMHFHWVQDEVRLKPKTSLLKWLKKYTWPYEAKFKNKVFSRTKGEQFAQELLQVGTLGGGCYSSIHGNALQNAMKNFIGDFVIGNVLMTINSPEYLSMSSAKSIKLSKKLMDKFGKQYALTPRFALSTDPLTMKTLGTLAKQKKLFIQTHLSETKNEIKSVLKLYRGMKGFEDVDSYTDIYDRCHLITDRSIFGHGIHLSQDEFKILRKKKSTIAHCPTSNAPLKKKGLGSGLFDFRRAEAAKVNWVLASDIGGGPYLSMFDVMESFVSQNKRKKIKEATYTKALYRSTLRSAEVLKLSKTHGNLSCGKYANMIFVESPRVRSGETVENVLQKIIAKCKSKRHLYKNLVDFTYYKGNEVYSSNQ